MKLRPRHLLTAITTAVMFAACANAGDNSATDDDSSSSGDGGAATDDDSGSTGPTSGNPMGPSASSSSSSGSSSSSSGQGGVGGGGEGGGGTTVTASSSSTGGGACAHDVCDEGVALTIGCGDPCVDQICVIDDFCCDIEWDSICVGEVESICGGDCGGGGGGNPGTVDIGDLFITEVMNNPKAVPDADGEWFEIYNASNKTLDLEGLLIHQTEADPNATHTITDSIVLDPGEFAVLGVNGDFATNGGVLVDYEFPGNEVNLNNTADYLALITDDATPVIIDATSWDKATGLNPNGKSRQLDPNFMSYKDNDDDTNFCEASTQIGGASSDYGTPGDFNDACP